MSDKKKILIVDDEPDFIKILKIRLEHAGYEIFEAANGLEGLEILKTEIPDLILLDVMMPDMNGYQFCRKVKSNEKTEHIPIIMVTAKAQESDKYWGLETGAVDYITKPYESSEMLEKIKKHII
ncbi:MAG: response regulator [Pseudomonadota bacterium]